MRDVEERAEQVLAKTPAYVWDGETVPVPVEDLVDSVYGLLVRDVEDMRAAPGAPVLAAGQSLSGMLLPARGEIWVNAEEARGTDENALQMIALIIVQPFANGKTRQ